MKNRIVLLAALLSFVSRAQDSVSVLFIGNSYIYTNDLPSMLTDLTNSLGDVIYYDQHTPGGTTFANHAANPIVYDKINDQLWDFVVLQAQSQEPSFPDSQVNSNTLPFAIQLADSVYANNFCSEALFFMTWGRENGDPQWGPISTFDGMNERLRNAYMRFADSVDGAVAPVGSAWKYIRDTEPGIGLYVGDGSHPSYEGSYLAACTFYASVFRKSPVGAPFIGTLDPTVAQKLQTAASLTVLDSLDQWNLRPISEHTQADFFASVSQGTVDFTNLSTRATNYSWDFGDGSGLSTDVSPSHTYLVPGMHTVTLIAESPCDSDTIQHEVIIQTIGLDENDNMIQIANLNDGHYQFIASTDIRSIDCRDASGRIIQPIIVLNGSTAKLDVSHFPSGVYLLSVSTESGNSIVRIHR